MRGGGGGGGYQSTTGTKLTAEVEQRVFDPQRVITL